MRQKIFRAGEVIYNYVKSPLGLVITGGIAGSTTTFFFDRTKLAKGIAHVQIDNQQLTERLLTMENENNILSRQNRELSLINHGYVTKSDELRDELRRAAADLAGARHHLNDCNKTVDSFESSMRNTWFFCKNHANNYQSSKANSDNPLSKH